MSAPFAAVLSDVARLRGVSGCMLVGESDGLIVASTLAVGLPGATVAALAASLYRKARRAAEAAGLGGATFMHLEAESGRLCAAGRGELVIVAVAEPRVSVGLVRVRLLRALDALP